MGDAVASGIGGGRAFDVDALPRLCGLLVLPFSNRRWNGHHGATPGAHREAGVLRQNEDTAAAHAADSELLNLSNSSAHGAAHGWCSDGVGQGDPAALASNLPG